MLPLDSNSFTLQRNVFTNSSGSSTRSEGLHCRRNLQDKFDDADPNIESKSQNLDRSVLSTLSFNINTRKILRNGAERISKTFNTFRTALGTISQRFKMPTKRRQILEEGPMTPNCATPYSRQILGRTPTKMYSPFSIESPYNSTTYDKENIPQNLNKHPSGN